MSELNEGCGLSVWIKCWWYFTLKWNKSFVEIITNVKNIVVIFLNMIAVLCNEQFN